MKNYILALLVMLTSVSTAQASDNKDVFNQLRQVIVEDGIDLGEADIIARAYYVKNIGCGAFESIEDGDKFWIVNGFVGYAGQPTRGVRINKKTGHIASSIGPSYKTPQDILK